MPGLDHLIPPPVLGVLTGAGIWKGAQLLPEYSFRALASPEVADKVLPYTPYIAGGLAAVGLGLQLSAVLSFNTRKTTITPLTPSKASTLVTDGVYAYTRNPMYLGLATILSAWSIYLDAPVVGLLGVSALVAYITQFQIKPEEKALQQIFPTEYPNYAKRVGRWF